MNMMERVHDEMDESEKKMELITTAFQLFIRNTSREDG